MGSLSMVDFITDKLLSFNLKKYEGVKTGSALCLMNGNSNLNQEHIELFHLLGNMLPFENNSSEQFKKLKSNTPLIEKLSRNFFMYNNLGFSPHLQNFVQDCVRSLSYSEMALAPSHNLNISHTLSDISLSKMPLNESELQHNYLNKNMSSGIKVVDSPVKESIITMKISQQNTPCKEKVEGSKKCIAVNGYILNLELANRKTRELQKRSKKRRRRQKKNRQNSSSNGQVSIERPSTKPSRVCNSKSDQADIGFVVSVEHNILVSPNIVSSFVISIDNVSDDDSDWDCISEANILTDTEEFEFGGLLVTNLSIPKTSSYCCPSSNCSMNQNDNPDEIAEINTSLVQVNKNWNESHKETDLKPKSPPKVSFAADDHLTEVLTVENYERKGEWEIYATERLRFKRRIEELEKVISPCFTSEHRLKIYKKLTKSSL